ncbi:hypothetical protein H696_03846 [Fonticula alba]|uniref:Ubiquitin-like domain-containing protein n=1 Tax=Fonticula alba TaxID=691883 RepID=A0A058Z583_FONAL|nr:hypothetical protein H696_03846 [Fonticula alba]KCV69415.1 hypothetical protein H696_03846 [Fonticula alba]|eukprot:XP_009495980.1 hypothetical protein H696_03846 [Fonticula alba]
MEHRIDRQEFIGHFLDAMAQRPIQVPMVDSSQVASAGDESYKIRLSVVGVKAKPTDALEVPGTATIGDVYSKIAEALFQLPGAEGKSLRLVFNGHVIAEGSPRLAVEFFKTNLSPLCHAILKD